MMHTFCPRIELNFFSYFSPDQRSDVLEPVFGPDSPRRPEFV